MDFKKRLQNESEFDHWEEGVDGGRTYWFEVKGRNGGKARYIKTTDSDEITLTFVQQIFDAEGTLIEHHQKYPIDTGHQTVKP